MLDFFSNLFGEKDYNQDYIQTEKDGGFFVDTIVDGQLPFQNTTITIRAYETKKKENPLQIKCKWYRVVDSRNYEIRNNNSQDSYHFNAYDIGAFVKVAVKVRGVKNLTILQFGPILLNPRLLPELENSLLADEGIYNFALLEYGDSLVEDESDYQNFIKFSRHKLQVMFGFMFQKVYENFELDLNGPHDYKILCENLDFRAISLYFKKGTEKEMEEEILLGCPRKKREYEVKKIEYQSRLESNKNPAGVELFEEGSLHKEDMLVNAQQRGRGIDELVQKKIRPRDASSDGSEFKLRIRFKTRLERDAFISAIRIITVMKTMALSPLLDQTDKAFDMSWSMGSIGLLARDQYNSMVGQMYQIGGAIQRVLYLNRSISRENQRLNDGTLALENELYDAIGEFKKMQKDVRAKLTKEQVQQVERVSKRMVDTSMTMQKLKDGGKVDKGRLGGGGAGSDLQKVKGLAKQIESTNKLNALLLKEIGKLKKGGPARGAGGRKRGAPANATMVMGGGGAVLGGGRLNRSGIDARQGDEFLLGLEDRAENNPFAKKSEPVAQKAQPVAPQQREVPDNLEEEELLINAIGDLQNQQEADDQLPDFEGAVIGGENQDLPDFGADPITGSGEDKMGKIVELELQKQLLNKQIAAKLKKFDDMLSAVDNLNDGEILTPDDLEGSLNPDIEAILDQQSSLQANPSQAQDLLQAVLLKYAESQCRQIDYLETQLAPGGQPDAQQFDTFQPVSFGQNVVQQAAADHDDLRGKISEVKEENKKLQNENQVMEFEVENLRAEVEKMQQEEIDLMEEDEVLEKELEGLLGMVQRIEEDNESLRKQVEAL